MFNFSLGLVVGVLVGWFVVKKPAVLDTLVAKVTGLFKK